LSRRQVKAFLYNRQVTDSITATFLSEARAAGIPVVAVYETMPTGYHYQSWMVAETGAVLRALRDRQSTPRL
jgi:zinc/manganese transport system substrate-binding protein